MTEKNRTTLKAYFRDGALPTAEQYSDLIDSGVNQIDDGFAKTVEDGLILTGSGNASRMLSLYEGLDSEAPSWVVDHGDKGSRLHFRAGHETAPGVTITSDGRMGVQTEEPEWDMDVRGVLRSHGRIGVADPKIQTVPADRGWHDVTRELTGCQAFEVMAGVGGTSGEGRYAMTHAIAMNAYHPRNKLRNWWFRRRQIKAQTAVYGSYADRISLQWVKTERQHCFKLQMRTHAKYELKDGYANIRFYLTKLWFDPTMHGSREVKTRPDDAS